MSNSWSCFGQTTVRVFTTIANATFSSRALGWDTNIWDPILQPYRGCGDFSPDTFTHTGYTGTQVCVDRDRQLIAILLTNRVYPAADERSFNAIHAARILFSNTILKVVDGR